MSANMMKPQQAKIAGIKDETDSIKTFTLRYADMKLQDEFSFTPGQFMMASIFGYGEMPISISSSPYHTESLDLTVANVGNASNAMHSLKKNDLVGLRGPFGNGYPIAKFRGKSIIFVAGGCGFAPLRSAVYAIAAKQEMFNDIYIFFGCKSQENMLFKQQLSEWGKMRNSHVLISVDEPSPSWKGHTGVVTGLFHEVKLPLHESVVLMCGPSVMLHFALIELKKMGFKSTQFYASLERLMHCGIGKCAHCNIAGRQVCSDGPVFNGDELDKLPLEER